MTYAPRRLLIAAIAVGAIFAGGVRAQSLESAHGVLADWLAAVEADDHAAYLACLHPDARSVVEYGSAGAVAFWRSEIGKLERRGFRGAFQLRSPAATSTRLPAGTLLAHPILDSGPSPAAIVLIPEEGRWTIARLFS